MAAVDHTTGMNKGLPPPPPQTSERSSSQSKKSAPTSTTLKPSVLLLLVGLVVSIKWYIGNDPHWSLSTVSPLSFFSSPSPSLSPLEKWIASEEKIAWMALKRNIHPLGTLPGTVVASPSTSRPDYWYQWTRDSALVMRTVVSKWSKEGMEEDRKSIEEYVEACQVMQHKETLVGGYETGGLGEVKFHVDYEPFMGEWGRPQNDGPASRAITLIAFANRLLDLGGAANEAYVRNLLYDSKLPTSSVIKADLEHIAHHYAAPGFDLWEEVRGSHFYTLLTIRTALLHGTSLALRLSDPLAASFYLSHFTPLTTLLSQFWSPSRSLIQVSLNQTTGRDSDSGENQFAGDRVYGKESGLDSAVILGVLHAGMESEWEGEGREVERVWSTLEELIKSMRATYPLNEGRRIPALGRYPEDIYDGVGTSLASPWFLCTLSAAEILFRASSLLDRRLSPIVVTTVSRTFYARFVEGVQIGDVIEEGRGYEQVGRGMRSMGDEFMSVVQEFASKNGSLHEQFDRITGQGRGARDLTWSYAAFITASEARRTAFASSR